MVEKRFYVEFTKENGDSFGYHNVVKVKFGDNYVDIKVSDKFGNFYFRVWDFEYSMFNMKLESLVN